MVDFEFIYELMAPYYSSLGRPSIAPVSLIKMLLIGYLFGIGSERRLIQELQLNIAYHWFCGFNIDDNIPEHSVFSQNRRRKWKNSRIFEEIFFRIVKMCIEAGIVDGEKMVADGSFIPSNVSRESWTVVERTVTKSMQSYLDILDEELATQPGFKKPPERRVPEKHGTSTTDRDSGYINQGKKKGIGYLLEATVDTKHGIVTGVDVYPANEKESLKILRHLEKQQNTLEMPFQNIALDRGYDTGAVHRGQELLGITGYIAPIKFPNTPQSKGFTYDENADCFICPDGKKLIYKRLYCNQSTGKYLRCYKTEHNSCPSCFHKDTCFSGKEINRKILASSCYPAFYRGHSRAFTTDYFEMMKRRKIWSEGTFAVLKREHNLKQIKKRGISKVYEECLLSAIALNLKRMVKACYEGHLRLVFLFIHEFLLFFNLFPHTLSTRPLLNTTENP